MHFLKPLFTVIHFSDSTQRRRYFRTTHEHKLPLWPIRTRFSPNLKNFNRWEKRKHYQGHTTDHTHTQSLDLGFTIYFLEDNLSCILSPPKNEFAFGGKPPHSFIYFFFPGRNFKFETTFANKECCKKNTPMFKQKAYLWAQCVIITTVFEVNTKKNERGKLVQLAGRKRKGE